VPLFRNRVETAQSELARLRKARVELEQRAESARAELERLRADLPNIALDEALGQSTNGDVRRMCRGCMGTRSLEIDS
jgi:chromosome segregation ATPase